MLLLAIVLAFLGILNLANTTPRISFKQLLDTCCKLENLNLKECHTFISAYIWHYDDIHLVYDKVLERESRTADSPAENILEERLLDLIQNPNFDLKSLGVNAMKRAIEQNHEPLAIAIWRHLKNYGNDSSDLQLQVCNQHTTGIMEMRMLELLTKMVRDRPDCLHQVLSPFKDALIERYHLPMMNFLYDHGAQLGWAEFSDISICNRVDVFEWAIRKNPSFLLKSISGFYSENLSKGIWNVMKRGNYSNLLLQICSNAIFHLVNVNFIYLVETMHKEFPECILSRGDILMDIAISGGMDLESMIRLLEKRGVDNTSDLVLIDPKTTAASGFGDMILFLNDIGVNITPEHLQHLSHNDNTTFEWAKLNTQLSKETFKNSPIKNDYFERAMLRNRFDLTKKILDWNVFEIENRAIYRTT